MVTILMTSSSGRIGLTRILKAGQHLMVMAMMTISSSVAVMGISIRIDGSSGLQHMLFLVKRVAFGAGSSYVLSNIVRSGSGGVRIDGENVGDRSGYSVIGWC